MTHSPANPDAALRAAVKTGNIVFVAGTGVSTSATFDPATRSGHPQASWIGLLKHGLDRAESMGQLIPKKAALYRELIEEDATTENLISTASTVTKAFGGATSGIFKQWLEDTVGKVQPKNRDIIDALHALREAGNLLATTNYDDVLLDYRPSPFPVTWMDGDDILGALKHRELEKIIYLHGYWKRPETVILDGRSYEHIARHEVYRDDLAALWKTTTWVYVGCSESGITDPDLGLLLERHGERARDAKHWDFCLVHNKDVSAFQKCFDERKLNIVAVPYGDNHSALPGFLRSLLPAPVTPVVPGASAIPIAAPSPFPQPPAFYAKPDYIGRHDFVGRTAQLQVLTEWAKPTDPTSILLFEAIGGNGKSMLTWEWTTKHAEEARAGHEAWAGRFWYSFYEKGAIMRDFCLHALAYMQGSPLEILEKKPMSDLRTALLAQLHARPWLLILDGLERVLVHYHDIAALERIDDDANRPTDRVLDRDPCATIRDEDTILLQSLAAAAPSKILVSSRLIPRALLNPSGLPLPGVRPQKLPGLDDADAERLFCEVCGIRGTSADIRYYLKTFCDNHPLVIGVLAGLINSPGPHRGHFDAWAAAPEYGAKLNLARLDLIQSRNHILLAAMDALEAPSRQLLSTLALLTDAVDYETVTAFDPHLPTGKGSPTAIRKAGIKLGETLQDLERRGLVQYDGITRRYDLHPVVRGVAAGGMKAEDKERYGQRVVDHFSAQPHPPYEQAKTMEDVASGLHVVRTLLKLGHHQQAAYAYEGDLSDALLYNLEAHVEVLSLLRPLFPAGWDQLPEDLDSATASYLANSAAIALLCGGEDKQAIAAFAAALRVGCEREDWSNSRVRLSNISASLSAQNRLAPTLRINGLALDLASASENESAIFISRLFLFGHQSRLGKWSEAEATWQQLNPMGRQWPRTIYGQGEAEAFFAEFHFWQGGLQEGNLTAATTLAEQDNNRGTLRDIHRLRGAWRLEQGEWALAAASFDTAVTMAREVRLVDAESETGLALAKHHLRQLTRDDSRSEAERLAQLRQPAHRYLAMLWLAIGDHEQATKHALAAYTWAWADGEPYVNRYELTKTTELLQQMNVPVPVLPPYDETKDVPFPWEADVRAAIEKLKAAKAAKKKQNSWLAKFVEGEVTRPAPGPMEAAFRGAGLLTSPSTSGIGSCDGAGQRLQRLEGTELGHPRW